MTVKVILIRPENSLGYYFDPPLGCMSVASVLKNKHNVVILDAKFESKNKILDECEDADLVGISAMTSEVGSGVRISDMIKNEYDVPIVWGGIHATLFPEITSNDNSVDCVIVGEGEELIIKVLNMIKNRKKLPSIIKSNRFVKLDSLPMVAYDLLDMERYVYHSPLMVEK